MTAGLRAQGSYRNRWCYSSGLGLGHPKHPFQEPARLVESKQLQHQCIHTGGASPEGPQPSRQVVFSVFRVWVLGFRQPLKTLQVQRAGHLHLAVNSEAKESTHYPRHAGQLKIMCSGYAELSELLASWTVEEAAVCLTLQVLMCGDDSPIHSHAHRDCW